MKTQTPLLDVVTAPDTLNAAWRHVRACGGAGGVDGVTLAQFATNADAHLYELAASLRDGSYIPDALRPAELPKADGGSRALAIPAVRDRVAQRAVVHVLAPLWESFFLPCSLGYRTGLGVANAVALVENYRRAGFDCVVDADIQDFFGMLNHAVLRDAVRRHTPDDALVRLIFLWLAAGAAQAPIGQDSARLPQIEADPTTTLYHEDDEDLDAEPPTPETLGDLVRRHAPELLRHAWECRGALALLKSPPVALALGGAALVVGGGAAAYRLWQKRHARAVRGAAQGSPLSPLLSNLYLHPFDAAITQSHRLRLVRYADDFVVCTSSPVRAAHALEIVRAELSRLKLAIHPAKTRLVPPGAPFDFLGCRFDGDGVMVLPPAKGTRRKSLFHARQSVQSATQSVLRAFDP